VSNRWLRPQALGGWLAGIPLHPLLVPVYGVLFLYAQNVQLVDLSQVLGPLVLAVISGVVLLALASLLLRNRQRGALLATALAAAFWFAGHVNGLVGVAVEIQLVGWAALAGGAVLLGRLAPARVATFNRGLSVAVAAAVALALLTIVPYGLGPPAGAQAAEPAPTGLTAKRTTERDIYYLVLEDYGSNRALEAGLGFTSDLPGWLEQHGFYVPQGSQANYVRTTLEMASTLNLTYLDEVAQRMGADNTDYRPLYAMIQDNIVGRFLREQGYRFIYLGGWYNPMRSIAVADENLNHDTTTEFGAVLWGTTLLSLLPQAAIPPEDQKHLDANDFMLGQLPEVASMPGPKFVMANILLPHPPYVYDTQGNYVSAADRVGKSEAELMAAQMQYLNDRVKALVSQLLDVPPDRQPIIIVQSDEGPYPARYRADQANFDWASATTTELVTKYGILNSFYLPDEPGQPSDVEQPYQDISGVNTFRLLLSRYFGLDLPLLADRSYTSKSPTLPYDLTDITDRLTGP
jgi:hypothetical protein